MSFLVASRVGASATMLSMSSELDQESKCPFCGADMESGTLLGRVSLRWCVGDYDWWTPSDVHDRIGEGGGLDRYAHSAGARCTKCRQIVISY